MKKKMFAILGSLILFLSGCGKLSVDDVSEKIFKKYKNISNYYVEASMTLNNNDDVYNYDVTVSYKDKDKYRVHLINKSNNYEQIIVKNADGVYVVTPSLNKSFKFQSDWPYNNSQAYLIQSVIEDMKITKEPEMIKDDNKYIFITNARYPSNPKMVKQKAVFDEKFNLKEVHVMDDGDVSYIDVVFNVIDFDKKIDDEQFKVESIIAKEENSDIKDNNISEENNESESNNDDDNLKSENSSLEISDNIFPLYIPNGTSLTSKETISKDYGQRIIMTFGGEKPFLLVEENTVKEKEHSIIPTYGEPYLLIDTIGVLTETSMSWSSNGIDYYIVSDVLSQSELLEVAKSINSVPVMK